MFWQISRSLILKIISGLRWHQHLRHHPHKPQTANGHNPNGALLYLESMQGWENLGCNPIKRATMDMLVKTAVACRHIRGGHNSKSTPYSVRTESTEGYIAGLNGIIPVLHGALVSGAKLKGQADTLELQENVSFLIEIFRRKWQKWVSNASIFAQSPLFYLKFRLKDCLK